MSVKGKVLVFSGTLTMKREEAKQLAEGAGAKVTGSVSGNTDIIVVGSGSETNSKVLAAKAKGVTVWTEKQFASAVKGGSSKKAASKKRKVEDEEEEEGEDEDEEEKPKKKAPVRGKKAASKEVEEEEVKSKKAGKKAAKKGAKKAKIEEVEDEIEEQEEEEEEEEEKPKKRGKKAATKRGAKKAQVEVEETEEAGIAEEDQRPSLWNSLDQSEDTITALIKNGADINETDDKCRSLLHVAAKKGYLPACAALLKAGLSANVATTTTWGSRTPLFFLAKSNTPNIEIIPLLLQYGADVNGLDGLSPLYEAAQRDIHGWKIAGKLDNSNVVAALIAAGAEVDHKDDWENTPLQKAVQAGNVPVVKMLIEHGANVNHANKSGFTSCHIVTDNIQGHAHEIAKILLEAGADLSMEFKKGKTPLKALQSVERALKKVQHEPMERPRYESAVKMLELFKKYSK